MNEVLSNLKVEVFRTNVKDADQALMLTVMISRAFAHYKANFDLEDCDQILRVVSTGSSVNTAQIIKLVSELGFHAEVLGEE